ncbi:MAG: MarR family transcriptional regulator [Leptolyngbya sp. PLA3]|nr:MAG: MarR family transcriptional regulator [Cyanobacteria bacterium CYA]MCE7969957.1 MarR family transcriptional regulator [Leptolyngbya sp. PL-A3]
MPQQDVPETPSDPTTAQRVVAGLAKVALVFRHAQWAASGERGLTPTQSQILAIITGSREPLGVKAVAQHLAVTMGTASEAVATLVSKGLLRKEADKSDGRAVVLVLTARGRREAARAAEWPGVIVEAAEAMPDGERALLLRGLVGMIRTMQARRMVPTARMCVECRYFRPNEHPGTPTPHRCEFIKAPIGDTDLRLDCAEMERAEEPQRLWEAFVLGEPLDRHVPGRTGAGRARPGPLKPRPDVHAS